MDERGQALPLVALVVVAAGVTCLAAGKLGGAAVSRAEASSAADAAALAGAVGGRDEARSVAEANGGRLVGWEHGGGDVRARVAVGRAVATARARGVTSDSWRNQQPLRSVTAPRLERGLIPPMLVALARAGELLGGPVPITSGYRSPEEQAVLWAHRATNPYPVAAPGQSAHQRGIAVDVPLAFVRRLAAIAGRVGLCHPYPVADPVHFELCPDG
jgi:hypothetical protein